MSRRVLLSSLMNNSTTVSLRGAFAAFFVSALCCLPFPAQSQQSPACCNLSLPTIAQQDALVPRISETVNPNGPTSYGVISLSNVPPGFSITNNVNYLAWCIDSFHEVNPGGTYFPHIFCSYDNANLINEGIPTANWDKI